MSQGGLRSTAHDLLGFAEAQIRATTENEDTVLARAMRRTRQPYFSVPYQDDPDSPIRSTWNGQVVQGLAWRARPPGGTAGRRCSTTPGSPSTPRRAPGW
ncbi:hypothetical protein D5S19_22390 [Amycolatopsis panacis]|uniref:Uncharacterized protein n=2 Tax=Amycolatopsis panacis TaxID=2340917 RepID=A0A419HYD6_9PSEU|nr:hypothetical protein D5S19_22390 [Amycolatopsis panacis]